jgi:hypothetical protein
MSRSHVSDLVRHHPGQFGLFIGRQNEPGIDIKTSGKARALTSRLNHFNNEDLGVRIANNVLPDAIDVLNDFPVSSNLLLLSS